MNNTKTTNRSQQLAALFLAGVLMLNDAFSLANALERLSVSQLDFQHLSVLPVSVNELDEERIIESEGVESVEAVTSVNTVSRTNSGPGQAETSGFSIGSTDGLVDKFTGDFSYSLPLMDVEGYPIVLSYNSNVLMNSEASWVGLGWDLNVGAISREMRGIPDEFNGEDEITRVYHQKDATVRNGIKAGGYVGLSASFFGGVFMPSLQVTALWGKYDHSYLGRGKTYDFGLQTKFNIISGADNNSGINLDESGYFGSGNFSYGYSRDTKAGISVNKSIGLSGGYSSKYDMNILGGPYGASYSSSYNSRRGLYEREYGFNFNIKSLGRLNQYIDGVNKVVTFGTPTSIPRVNYHTSTSSMQINSDAFVGFKTLGMLIRVGGMMQNYSSTSNLVDNNNYQIHEPAFGYLHSGKRLTDKTEGKFPVMDFDRSTDYSFSYEMKDLPFSIQTYDLFYVNALGINSTFRAGRTDFGTYYDPVGKSQTNYNQAIGVQNYSAGVTFNSGVTISAGASLGDQEGEVKSGVWSLDETFAFQSSVPLSENDVFDRTIYFKAIGEETPNDLSAWDATGGNMADNFDVNVLGKNIELTDYLKESETTLSSIEVNGLNEEPVIATYFKPSISGDINTLTSYFEYTYQQGSFNRTYLSRLSGIRKSNHISAIDVYSVDGAHYQYGIPVYNIENSEVMFASEGLTYNSDKTTVQYSPGIDNSVNNVRGSSGYFDKTTMPAYPHSFLLTSMTSSDYVDRTDNGPSIDDIGSYYSFHYTRIYDESTPYTWRFPVSGTSGSSAIAMQNRGILGTTLDDMANYNYGEKEIWYSHSIESRNQIAFFILKDREDAYGCDENGILNGNLPLKCIDKILLYNLSDYKSNPSTAVPLQTIEFEYDYSLCPGAPSNLHTYNGGGETGKLTLKKIRVYNGKSKESALQVYSFEYSSENPSFNYGHTDGWGNNKDNNTVQPNDLFPYVNQTDESVANASSRAWKLTAINNPLGGRTEIEYEADRYGYVQKERAMHHFTIKGMMNIIEYLILQDQQVWNGTDNLHNELRGSFDIGNLLSSYGYTNYANLGTLEGPNNVIVFQLENSIVANQFSNTSEVVNFVKDAYFKNEDGSYLSELFFKTMTTIKPGVTSLVPYFAKISENLTGVFNIISSFSSYDINSIGVMPPDANGTYKYGYVVLESIDTRDIESPKGEDSGGDDLFYLHPLQFAALGYARQNLTDKIYGACASCEGDLSIDKQAKWRNDIYKYMVLQGGYAPSIICESSVMRLYDSDNIKFGGNGRVKQVTYYDNWSSISGEYSTSYTWDYDYSGSGVVSFESGGLMDENPLYKWDSYVNIAKRLPDETMFHPTPIASVLFPIPVVGYDEIKTVFSGGDYGYSITRYFTNKDFPTIERKTQLEKSKSKNSFNLQTVLNKDHYTLYGFTQGYEIETNDFHGKLKESAVYNRTGDLQIRSTYNYYDLGEKLPMLDRSGNLSNESVSQEYDIHVDSRYVEDNTNFGFFGLDFFFTFGIPPRFGLTPSFAKTKRQNGFYSNCLIKHINRSAIVKSIETEYLGSINSAEDLVYDKYSGFTILSSLKDEFNDKLYSFNYPAHWYYEELREKSAAVGHTVQGTLSTAGAFVPVVTSGVDLTDYFTPGDKVKLTTSGSTLYGYVLNATGSNLVLIQESGALLNGSGQSYLMEITASGRDNRLGEVMQSVVTKKNISVSEGTFTFPEQEIISSGVLTYKEKGNLRCAESVNPEGITNEVATGAIINPFLYGVRGDLVPDGQFMWQSDRINNAHAHGIRFDGAYSSFVSYYKLGSDTKWHTLAESQHPNSSTYTTVYPQWRKMGEVKMYDEYGQPLYGVDQIKVPSAVLYGYNTALSLLPVAQAVNARNQDIAYDGFEDYGYYATGSPYVSESHFDFKSTLNSGCSLSSTERHSGLQSLAIPGGITASVTKGVDQGSCTPKVDPNSAYTAMSCRCIPPFEPSAGEYIVGAWLKQASSSPVEIKITLTGGSGSTPVVYTFTSSGTVLDGWQRLEGTFTIPSGYTNIVVSVINSGASTVYLDDFRLHPFLAGMTTVVYDPKTLLPLATHDGYNFTTYYNYDENLNLVRVRVETEKGIQTVSESEAGGQKSYKN